MSKVCRYARLRIGRAAVLCFSASGKRGRRHRVLFPSRPICPRSIFNGMGRTGQNPLAASASAYTVCVLCPLRTKTPSASMKQTVFLHCIFSQAFAQIPSPRRFSPSGNVLQRFSAALSRFSSRLLHKCFTVFSFSTLLSTVSCGAGQPFPSLFFTITRGTSISCSVRPA